MSLEPRGLRLVVNGQGGIGKTAAALELAYEQLTKPTYELVAWLDCDQPKFKEGQLARSPAAAHDIADIASDLAHIAKAEAALRTSDPKEAFRALRVRLAELRGLVVVDGFEGAFSAEGEQFLLGLPHTIDLIVTSRRELGWPESITIAPWAPDSQEAKAFLLDCLAQQALALSPTQLDAALALGRGVPLGISWSATLLARGTSERQIADLAAEGWSRLLDHFFEEQWAASFRHPGRRRAAAYLVMAGSAAAQEIEKVAAGPAGSPRASTAAALVDANLGAREGENIASTPFARDFIMRKMGQDEKRVGEALDVLVSNLLGTVNHHLASESWGLVFDKLDLLRPRLTSALQLASKSKDVPADYLNLTAGVAYYFYSRGAWDDYLSWEGSGLQAALAAGRSRYVIEVGLVWGTRIRLHRDGYPAAIEFFERVSAALFLATQDDAVKQMHLVAQSVLRRPADGDVPLAQSLENHAAELLELGEQEWACRAMLHAGNVWSELGKFGEAARSFEWIAERVQSDDDLSTSPWKNEMLSLSVASRGILANRQERFGEALTFLGAGLEGLVQTYDLASALGEYALALYVTGNAAAARPALEICLENKHRLNITKTVMESRLGWDLVEGPAALLAPTPPLPWYRRFLRRRDK